MRLEYLSAPARESEHIRVSWLPLVVRLSISSERLKRPEVHLEFTSAANYDPRWHRCPHFAQDGSCVESCVRQSGYWCATRGAIPYCCADSAMRAAGRNSAGRPD